MDRQLLEAAIPGSDFVSLMIRQMAPENLRLLLRGVTPRGNNCLHITSTHGHEGFCRDVLALDTSLLAAVNADGETPLLAAVTSGHAPLASLLLGYHLLEQDLSEAVLQQDQRGCNALHHAIRCGHKDLAVELIAAKPSLSHAVNQHNESAMFMAVMRDFADILEKLLEIPDSSDKGPVDFNALHAAVRNGNSGEPDPVQYMKTYDILCIKLQNRIPKCIYVKLQTRISS